MGSTAFYGGIAVMAAAVALGLAAAIVLRSAGRQLNERLWQEFGDKRR